MTPTTYDSSGVSGSTGPKQADLRELQLSAGAEEASAAGY